MDKKDAEKHSEKDHEQNLVRSFDTNKNNMFLSPKITLILLVLVILGLGSGYVLGKGQTSPPTQGLSKDNANKTSLSSGTSLGSDDKETFKDSAEGVLKKGGIEGEGQFHLERPGGESQNVYLTSSTVDLSLLLDREIKVWGQTQTAQHAGWLMDVGRVEIK